MGLYLHQYRAQPPLDADALAAGVRGRLGLGVSVRSTTAGLDVRAPKVGGRASLSFDGTTLSLEAGVPGNPVFLEQLGAALEDLGAVPLDLITGEPKVRATPPPRRWQDEPIAVRARHGFGGQLAFALAFKTFELFVLLTLPVWLLLGAFRVFWQKARA